jgi:rubrerythrin
MKLSEVLQQCAGIERLISEVYETFATRWPEPPLGALWRELAAEEVTHGRMLDDVAKLPIADRDDRSMDRGKLQAMRDFVNDHFPSDSLSLDEALAFALDLEDLELENIYRRVFAITTDDCRVSTAVRKALREGDRHAARITQAIEARSSDPTLLARARVVKQRALRAGAMPAA